MTDQPAIDASAYGGVEHVTVIEQVGRVASFRLPPGGALPETRSTPVFILATTDLMLDLGGRMPNATPLTLQAGQVYVFPNGVAGLVNIGSREARFTLIDLPADREQISTRLD